MTQTLTDFDRDYSQHRRRSRVVFWSVAIVLFLLTWATSALSGFFKVTQYTLPDGSRAEGWVIPAGLPRLGEYLSKTIPELRWDSLGADLAAWFGRGAIWAELLLETVLIGFLATLFGVVGGLLLSFPASRNLSTILATTVRGHGHCPTSLRLRSSISTISTGNSSAISRGAAR